MKFLFKSCLCLTLAIAGALGIAPCFAQFDSSRVKPEPALVAQRYPDPTVSYGTPGLEAGRMDFPNHLEVMRYLRQIAQKYANVLSLDVRGVSQQGREIPLLILRSAQNWTADPKPTILFIGQQHGNEPAGGEAALALLEQLLDVEHALLAHVNVLIMPRANPDGAEHFVRETANGLDVNRDHLLLQTPEAKAIAAVALQYQPQIVVDMHEFTAGDRWLAKFASYAKYDALVQAASVGNMNANIESLANGNFVAAVRAALEQQGLSSFWYHTSSAQAEDRVVSMGGVQPDTGRNVYGLRHAVSLLIETRGVGLGRAHFLRRVHTHVLAALAILKLAGKEGQSLVEAMTLAGQMTTAQACQGDVVIRAQATAQPQTLTMVDAVSGLDRELTVDWRSALAIEVLQKRTRPCGYWLSGDQTSAVRILQQLGVLVTQLTKPLLANVESYEIISEHDGRRLDTRGAIQAQTQQGIRQLSVSTQTKKLMLSAGGWYVPMNQPLAHLAIAALEPDSQNSLVANRILSLDTNSLLRVITSPSRTAMAP